MRTIKFRFYDKNVKQMRYFDSIWNMPDPDYDFDEIQQFTGLLDKNGKMIFEGDIDNYGRQAVFVNGCFKWINKEGFSARIGDRSEEIIGNIYQNNNLLK